MSKTTFNTNHKNLAEILNNIKFKYVIPKTNFQQILQNILKSYPELFEIISVSDFSLKATVLAA